LGTEEKQRDRQQDDCSLLTYLMIFWWNSVTCTQVLRNDGDVKLYTRFNQSFGMCLM
jgi:hypothetical protein